MFGSALLSVGALLGFLAPSVNALGSSCTAPLTKGNAGPNDPFWVQTIKHQGECPLAGIPCTVLILCLGISAFNPNATAYKVFRNVMVRN